MVTHEMPFPRCDDQDAWQGISPAMRAEIIARGDALLRDDGYPALTATQFMVFAREGDRNAFTLPYFARRNRLIEAVLTACLRPDAPEVLDIVTDGLWLLCEESTWCLSAHDESQPLPDVSRPTLDLFAAQTGALVSWVCYLLEDRLLPMVVERVRAAVDARVLSPFITRDDFWWMGNTGRVLNNWTPWILSNVLACGQIWGVDIAQRAETMLDRWLAFIPEDGGLDEGIAYWNMAGGSLLDCLERLGTDRYHEPKIRNLAAFPLHTYLGDGYFLNFADCDAKPVLDGERVYTFGVRTGNAELAALGALLLGQHPSVFPRDTPEFTRCLCRLFTPVPDLAPPVPAPYTALPDLQVWIRRQGPFAVAIKGGHNDESHNHNDIGSIIVYLRGKPAIVDAGNITYTGKTFDPAWRYTLWNTRSRNHNVPIIGDYEQQAGEEYRATSVRFLREEASMDIAAAYPAQAGVQSLVRTLRVQGDALVMEDAIQLAHAKPVQWVFMLREPPDTRPDCVVSGSLRLRYPQGLVPACETIAVEDARMARCYPGTLYRLTLTGVPAKAFDVAFCIEEDR